MGTPKEVYKQLQEGNFSKESGEIGERAVEIAENLKHEDVTADHLLLALLIKSPESFESLLSRDEMPRFRREIVSSLSKANREKTIEQELQGSQDIESVFELASLLSSKISESGIISPPITPYNLARAAFIKRGGKSNVSSA